MEGSRLIVNLSIIMMFIFYIMQNILINFLTFLRNPFVQFKRCTFEHLLANFDCVVQSPTGSGKSLAFLLPVLHILVQKRKECPAAEDEQQQCQVLAVVVAPGRELVTQLWRLFTPVCKALGMGALKLHGAGGERKKRVQDPDKHLRGQCILICTPGRFEHYLEKKPALKNYLKHLEVLIIDEADRYSDRESMRSLTTLLSVLPKQRRTALFSATQASGVEQLLKFGMRNPIRLNVVGSEVETQPIVSCGVDEEDAGPGQGEVQQQQQPKELTNYYSCVPASLKLLALVKFLRSQSAAKVLVFVSNASQAEYFAQIIPPLLESDTKKGGIAKGRRAVLSLHRKMNDQRQKVLERFRATDHCVLFTTDLLARGVDVIDIDWVVQYDIPKLSRLFIHRSGRSGRMGRAGRSLLLLMEEESAYIQFMQKHENVKMAESGEFGELLDAQQKAHQLRERVQQMAIEDRKILELGSSAFVSYIEAYNRHDCQAICRVKNLDIAGIAWSFGLLRMPRIREFQNRTDLRGFEERTDVKTSQIKFKDEKLEAKRMEKKREEPEKRKMEERNKRREHKVWGRDAEEEDRTTVEKVKGGKRKKNMMTEWDQLQREQRLLKKFKKGKIGKAELEEQI